MTRLTSVSLQTSYDLTLRKLNLKLHELLLTLLQGWSALKKLDPSAVEASELAGEKIVDKLTNAPGNGAAIGGLKVVTENGWFAARPSGTENVYKIYMESFKGEDHLKKIETEAQEIVNAALKKAGV